MTESMMIPFQLDNILLKLLDIKLDKIDDDEFEEIRNKLLDIKETTRSIMETLNHRLHNLDSLHKS